MTDPHAVFGQENLANQGLLDLSLLPEETNIRLSESASTELLTAEELSLLEAEISKDALELESEPNRLSNNDIFIGANNIPTLQFAGATAETNLITGAEQTIFVEPEPLAGDADGDRDIDLDDVRAITTARNTNANGDDEPRDIDGDGRITVLDARQLSVTVRSNNDNTAPELSGGLLRDTAPDDLFNNDGITFDSTIVGTIFDDSELTSLKVGINNTEELTEIISVVEADGSFRLTSEHLSLLNDGSLSDGDYTIYLQGKDKWGNQTELLDVSFTLDTTAPELDITEPLADSNISAESQLIGTVNEDMVTLSYRFNDGEAIEVAITEGGFAQSFDLTGLLEGENSLTLVATDKAGNVTEETVTVKIEVAPGDITPPVISTELATDTGSDNTDSITSNPEITGSVTDDLAVASLKAGFGEANFDITDALQPDGSFRVDADKLAEINGDNLLTDGAYTLNLVATDEAGNESSNSITFTLDTTASTAAIFSTPNPDDTSIQIVFNEAVTGDITVAENYTLTLVGGETITIDSVTQVNSTTVRLNLASALVTGSYQLEIAGNIQDSAGNTTETQSLDITLVAEPGEPVEISPFDGEEMVTLTRETIVRFDKKIDPETVTSESFYAIANGQRIPGRIVVSSTEEFATLFYDEPLPQSTEVRVVVEGDSIIGRDGIALDADGDGTPGGQETADFTTLPLTQIEGTDVFGYVYDAYNTNPDGSDIPLEGVRITLDSLPDVFAVTDENGYFILEDVPAPEFYVYIDGSEVVGSEGTKYASLGKAFHSVPGEAVRLTMDGEEFDVYLPPMADSDIVELSPTEDTDVGFGESSLALLEESFPDIDPEVWARTKVTYPAGSAQNDAGEAATQAIIVPVDPDRLPAPLPPFINPQLIISVQAGSEEGFNRELEGGATNFDVPAPIQFPNLEGLAPGEKSLIWSFNHDAGDWEVIGTGTVSDDGLVIKSDEGVGILAPGWHFVISGTQNQFTVGVSTTNSCMNGDDWFFSDGLLTLFDNVLDILPTYTRIETILQNNALAAVSALTLAERGDISQTIPFYRDFFAGGNGTRTEGPNSQLSREARTDPAFEPIFENVRDQVQSLIDLEISSQAQQGFVNGNLIGEALLNSVTAPLPTFNNGNLAVIVHGTQGAELSIDNFQAEGTIISPEVGGSGTWQTTFSYTLCDDFGFSEDDFTTPFQNAIDLLNEAVNDVSLFNLIDAAEKTERAIVQLGASESIAALHILQKHGSAKPYQLDIVVEEEITGTFEIPPGFVDVIIIESQRQDDFAPLSSNLTNNENTSSFSTIEGFGNKPTVYYKYVLNSGIELVGSTEPNNIQNGFVLPPNEQFTATFYAPIINSSTVISGVSSESGQPTFFLSAPLANSVTSSRVNLTEFGGLDSDEDGIPDIGEFVIGSDSNNTDTDGDGISDAAELEQGLDLLGGQAFPTGIIASIPLLGEAKAIVVEGSTDNTREQPAYVATGSHGLAIVDASQFNNPIVLGQLNLTGDATDVAVDNNLNIAAVATNSGGLQLVDVSDPMLPTLIQNIDINANKVEVADGVAYATVGTFLKAIDLLTGEEIQSITLAGSGTVTDLAIEGTQLYSYTIGSDTFAVTDISNPGSPALVGQINVSTVFSNAGISAGNGVAYIASSNLSTVDISNPTQPTLIQGAGSIFFPAKDISLNGSGLGLVAAEEQGLAVYNTSDPKDTDDFLTVFDTPGFTYDVAIASGIAYVADGSGGLQVINYLGFDNQGVAPTVNISSNADLNSDVVGIQVLEGSAVPIQVDVSDDVQVRNVELLVNDEVVANDISFPFDFSAIALAGEPEGTTIDVQVRATDTGGNISLSTLLTIDIVPDNFAPEVISTTPKAETTKRGEINGISVRFNEGIDPELVTLDGITLTNLGEDGVVGGDDTVVTPQDVQVSESGRTLFVFPPGEIRFPPGNYQLTLDPSIIRDRAGNALEKAFTLNFTKLSQNDPITLGETISDTFFAEDEDRIFTFTGTAGQRIYFDGISGNFNVDANLVSPSGVNLFSFRDVNRDLAPLSLIETGTYQLVITNSSSNNEDYSFRLLDATGEELALDTLTEGTLDPGTTTDLFSFTATEGQKFFLDGQGDTFAGTYTIYDPSNSFVTSQSFGFDLEFTAPTDGTYLFVVRGSGNEAVNYSFNLITPEIIVQDLTLGETIIGNISEPGKEDLYTFTGNAGQRIYFDGISGNSNVDANLVSPSGVNLFSFQNVNRDLAPLSLIETGTYQLVITNSSSNNEGYSFRLLDATEEELALDTLTEGTLDPGTTTDLFSFTATEGQKFFLDVDGQGDAFAGTYTIYDPANEVIFPTRFRFLDLEFTAPANGTYLLALQGAGNEEVNYSFNLITPETTATEDLTFGEKITGNISELGEEDLYTFTGTMGQTLYFDGISSDNFNLIVNLISPSGQIRRLSSSSSIGNDDDLPPRTLTENGIYKLQVDGIGAATGDYSFQILDTANATPFNLDEIVSGSLASNTSDLFQFEALAGQTLFLDGIGNRDGIYRIYNSGNNLITAQSFGRDRQFTITNDGTYFLLAEAEPTFKEAIDYSFQISEVSFDEL